jgi:hypothetical protein
LCSEDSRRLRAKLADGEKRLGRVGSMAGRIMPCNSNGAALIAHHVQVVNNSQWSFARDPVTLFSIELVADFQQARLFLLSRSTHEAGRTGSESFR